MADLTATIEPSGSAWILKRRSNSPRHSVRIDLGSTTPDQPNVRLRDTVQSNDKGERLVTLFVVNGQLEPDDNKDCAWLFPPQNAVEAPEGRGDKSVFWRRPSYGVVVDQPERDRLALTYRNRLGFAGNRVECQGQRSGARYRMVGIYQ
jgi:hypothetical protein